MTSGIGGRLGTFRAPGARRVGRLGLIVVGVILLLLLMSSSVTYVNPG